MFSFFKEDVMSLVPRNPWEALTPLREAMNQLFEESFVGPRFELITGRAFPVDVYESQDKKEYIVEAALPGIKPQDLQITVEGNTVNIRATKKEEEKVEKGTYMRRERFEGEMSRMIALPDRIDADKVQASYEDGILVLHIPKSVGAQPKQISIQTKEGPAPQ
jgi:HSP20 family protein